MHSDSRVQGCKWVPLLGLLLESPVLSIETWIPTVGMSLTVALKWGKSFGFIDKDIPEVFKSLLLNSCTHILSAVCTIPCLLFVYIFNIRLYIIYLFDLVSVILLYILFITYMLLSYPLISYPILKGNLISPLYMENQIHLP